MYICRFCGHHQQGASAERVCMLPTCQSKLAAELQQKANASPALITTEGLARLIALLVQARPHCPEELQQEIRKELSEGFV